MADIAQNSTGSSGMHFGIELGGTSCKVAIYKETGNTDEPLTQVFLEQFGTSEVDPEVLC